MSTLVTPILFQASSLPFRLLSVALTNTKSPAWKSSLRHPELFSLDSVSSIMINDKEFNTEPWCNSTWTRKSPMKVPLTLIQIQVLLPYIDCTIRTKNSSMHSFLKAHHTTSFGTQSKFFIQIYRSKFRHATYLVFTGILVFWNFFGGKSISEIHV